MIPQMATTQLSLAEKNLSPHGRGEAKNINIEK